MRSKVINRLCATLDADTIEDLAFLLGYEIPVDYGERLRDMLNLIGNANESEDYDRGYEQGKEDMKKDVINTIELL